MTLKITAIVCAAIFPMIAGCQTGNSAWSKPGYQGAPAAGSASRTYTPTESVSPYSQNNSGYGGSQSNSSYGGSQSNSGYGGSSPR